MAGIITENIDYSGMVVNEITREAISEQVFVNDYGPDVKTAYKSKYFIFDASVSAVIGAYTHTPALDSTAVVSQRTADLCEFRASGILEHKVFIATWFESQYATGMVNEKIESTEAYQVIRDLFINEIMAQYSASILLYGDVAEGSGIETLCQGLFAEFMGRAGNITLEGNLSFINNTDPLASSTTYGDVSYQDNVYGQLLRLVYSLPAKLRYRNTKGGRPVLAIDPLIDEKYREWRDRAALSGGGNLDPTRDNDRSFRGYELKVLTDLKEGEMFFTDPKNVMIITDDQNDFSKMTVIDRGLISLEAELWWDIQWRGKSDVKRADEMAYYQIA